MAGAQDEAVVGGEIWLQIVAQRVTALSKWGRRAADSRLLAEAVATGENAALLLPPETKTESRLMLMRGLMLALSSLGQATGDPPCFQRAIEIGEQALASFEPKTHLPDWIELKNLIAYSYRDWADFVEGTEQLDSGILHLRSAIQGITREDQPTPYAETRRTLAHVLVELGRRSPGLEALAEVAAICREELEHLEMADHFLLWTSLNGNLAKALCLMAERTGDGALFAESVAAYRRALRVRSKAASPFFWALGCSNLADALRLWHRIDSRAELLEEASELYRAALEVLRSDNYPGLSATSSAGLLEVERLLAESESAAEE